MSHLIITPCPTLANPEEIHDVEQLRQELHRVNIHLMETTDELNEAQATLHAVASRLSRLVVGHMNGKHEFVHDELDEIVARYIKPNLTGPH